MCRFKILLFLVILISSFSAIAQVDGVEQDDVWMEDNIFLDGVVSNYYTEESISGVTITATEGGKTIASGVSDGKGKYKMVLEYDKIYTITFSKSGHAKKIIQMNTSGVPDLKKQKVPDMIAEITLFKHNDCINEAMLKNPIGRAKYFPSKNVMDWDMDYSMPLLAKLNKMLDDCAEKIEEQKRLEEQKEKEYTTAMKTADKAFAKEDWDNAKDNYKKATTLFPDQPEPKKKLALIATEIAKKAEAKKQRAEEKARAEAEAIAKAKAEAAAKKEEKERLAKEKAQVEMLAKANAEATQKAKAEAAAQLAEKERLAKEKAKEEAKVKKEAQLKAQLKKEAAAKKVAEQNALKDKDIALKKMKEEEKAKLVAQKEAKLRADAEAQSSQEKLAAKKQEISERKAKEIAAQKALKAEEERALNKQVIVQVQAEIKVNVQVELNSTKTSIDKNTNTTTKGSSSIKIKSRNKSRHLYVRPNKHRKGKGPKAKKRVVF